MWCLFCSWSVVFVSAWSQVSVSDGSQVSVSAWSQVSVFDGRTVFMKKSLRDFFAVAAAAARELPDF
ncbi:hypothetical protein [Methanimicrococcus hongohii]|uniref:hypothetical protein n=1 Tax=Methanimicrococcus hongohii TaxID=3028295 RepID=UPI0029313C60|nr:hypothetical protein [Methanimicrococcus sp. Hf6]